MHDWIKKNILLLMILVGAICYKSVLVFTDAFPFNADEAVVALMARHILSGERPAFFYGQAYMGSLDAFLVACGFWIFGQKVWVIRLIQSFLYVGTITTTAWIGETGYKSRKAGIFSAALLALPPVGMTLYSTVSLGGYGEAFLIGNLLFLLVIRMDRNLWNYGLFGLLAGLGFWTHGLTLLYTIPSGIFLLVRLIRERDGFCKPAILKITWMFLGGVIGAAPWIVSIFQNGISKQLQELLGSAVQQESPEILQLAISRLVNFFLLGLPSALGLRPTWGIRWLALPLAPIILAFWMGISIYTIRRIFIKREGTPLDTLLLGMTSLFLLGFLLTPFGNDPSGRYFLPLVIALALIAGRALDAKNLKPIWGILALCFILAYQLIGTIQCAIDNPPGITTQFDAVSIFNRSKDEELIRFLEDQGETTGYTNYWVSYPIAFLSEEKLIYTPRLPYHQDFRYTSRDNRYPPYDVIVEKSRRTAYIITNHPELEAKIREGLKGLGVDWKENRIGDYGILYGLSRPVRPEELGIKEK